MRAMVLTKQCQPLVLMETPIPIAGPGELLLKVLACGVCRTDLHILDGELREPVLPLILGHEIVGQVVAVGEGGQASLLGKRMGVPWLGRSCAACPFCRNGQENLCDHPTFTGYTSNGGYAEYAVASLKYCFPIPEHYSPAEAAPLLCAGLIGFRALTKAGDAEKIGLYGFGAAAHIVVQVAVYQGRKVYAFTKAHDHDGQKFAADLGAVWSGGSEELPPAALDSAIIFAPAGHLVPQALRVVRKGGVVVCAGIHMSDIPSFPYHLLWGERTICSVANLTREDGVNFFAIAPKVPVRTSVQCFPLEQANLALQNLRQGRLQGAAVLIP